jgi:hypothetical protein
MRTSLLTVLILCAAPVSSWALDFDSDVPSDVQTQVVQDLAFMKDMRGAKVTPLHQQIYGAMEGGYYNWFDSRVKSVGINDCGNPNAVACVIPFQDSTKIWFTQNYIKFDHPQIAKMMVVYHEARHTEDANGNWMHASCPDPFRGPDGSDMKSIWTGAMLAGQPACDVTPLGSYGSSTILLKNIQKFCANCTDKVKSDAGIFSDDQLGRIIDADAKSQMQKDFATQ